MGITRQDDPTAGFLIAVDTKVRLRGHLINMTSIRIQVGIITLSSHGPLRQIIGERDGGGAWYLYLFKTIDTPQSSSKRRSQGTRVGSRQVRGPSVNRNVPNHGTAGFLRTNGIRQIHEMTTLNLFGCG